ncbi:ferrous iron transport protein A [Candidatus Bathyarchaeota archaeon]|nr:MAG: ferrous iron transport protein A [Candidatus Bathyarchaeota archaeon]RLI16042.1 MAG: ferrous iron transport protein A [Candidatus Bathyarchaeota archaeon]
MMSKMPLAMLSENEEAIVVEIRGGRGLVRRLSEMGFTYGAKVRILHSSSPGPVLVSIRGSRIALGRGAAMKILVNLEVEKWQ